MPGKSSDQNRPFTRAIQALRTRERPRLNEIDDRALQAACLPGLITDALLDDIAESSGQRAEKVIPVLRSLVHPVRTVSNEELYRTKDDVRSEFIQRVGFDSFYQSVVSMARRSEDAFEQLFHEAVLHRAIPQRAIDEYGAEATIRVASILKPSLPSLPSTFDLQKTVRRIQRERSFERPVKGIFVGREVELSNLHKHITSDHTDVERIIEIQGAAGTGKTTLVKRALSNLLGNPNHPIIHIDFERPISNQSLLTSLCRETLYSFVDLNLCDEATYRLLAEEINIVSDIPHALVILSKIFERRPSDSATVVIFLDSVELFANDYGDIPHFLAILESITEEFSFVRIISATRHSVLQFELPVKRIVLGSLNEGEILNLCSLNGLDLVRSRFVLRLLPDRNPLLAILVIELIKREKRFSLNDLAISNDVHRYLFQKFAIDRIIAKISSPLAREIALAAVPLRRVSEGMLHRHDIFPSLRPILETRHRAIFDQISSQTIFFEKHDGDLYLRMDIRALLIKLSEQGIDKQRSKLAREAAVEYLRQISPEERTFADSVDIIYYLLVLDKDWIELENSWFPGAGPELNKYVDEFSNRGRAWFKRKTGKRWTKVDFLEAFDEDVHEELIEFAQVAIHTGRSDELEEIIKHRAGPADDSPPEFDLSKGLLSFVRREWSLCLSSLHAAAGSSDNKKLLEFAALYALRCYLLSGGLNDVAALARTKILDIVERFDFVVSSDYNIEHEISLSLVRMWVDRAGIEYWRFRRRGANQIPQILLAITNRLNVQSSQIDHDIVTEFCLLGSLYDPAFIIFWLKAVDLRRLSDADAQQLLATKSFVSLFGVSKSSELSSHTTDGWRSRLDMRRRVAKLPKLLTPNSYLDEGDIPLFRQMIARTSGVFNGLLIEQLISWFPELGPADIKFLETIIEHRLPPRIHTRTLVAAAVRKLRSEGRLLAVFSNLQNIQDKKTREFPVMMERWTKFFDVNIF